MDKAAAVATLDKPPERPKRKVKAVRNYENVNVKAAPVPVPRITALPWDSDDDPICSASESLENEIFKELERASFDEEKLNEAIKNFDKILNDYKEEEEKQSIISSATAAATVVQVSKAAAEKKLERPEKPRRSSLTPVTTTTTTTTVIPELNQRAKPVESSPNVAKGKSKIPLSRQVLTKSKTCSIIESKCILKKSLSHDGDLSYCVKVQQNASAVTCNKFGESIKGPKRATVDSNVKLSKDLQSFKKGTKPQANTVAGKTNVIRSTEPRSLNKVRPVEKVTPMERPIQQKDPLTRTKSEWDIRGSRIPVKQMTTLDIAITSTPLKAPVTRTLSVSTDSTDCSTTATERVAPPSIIQYAKVVSASNPKLESCKVIPAVPFSGAAKDKPVPVPVKDVSKISVQSKVCRLLQQAMPDQDYYQSDNSDDSGHISNESTASSSADTQSLLGSEKLTEQPPPGRIKGDLLKYFEPALDAVAKPNQDQIPKSEGDNQEVYNQKLKGDERLQIGSYYVGQRLSRGLANIKEFSPYFQVFFRCGILNQLEAKRDELLSGRIIQMQACCRGYLARRKMARRRVQVMIAMRCKFFFIDDLLMVMNLVSQLCPGNRREMHSAKCESILRCSRLALVEIIGASHAAAQCASHRGAIKIHARGNAELAIENGKARDRAECIEAGQ